jgi:hypothetical protein
MNESAERQQDVGQPEVTPGEKKGKRKPTPPPSEALGLVDAEHLAKELGVSLKWVIQQRAKGELPCVRIGRRLLFHVQSVIEVLSAPGGHAQPEAPQRTAPSALLTGRC